MNPVQEAFKVEKRYEKTKKNIENLIQKHRELDLINKPDKTIEEKKEWIEMGYQLKQDRLLCELRINEIKNINKYLTH